MAIINNDSRKLWKEKCYICGKKDCCFNKHLNDEQWTAKELWRQNQEFRGDMSKYNIFLADYVGDLDNKIDNINEKANLFGNNDKDMTQYVIYLYLSNTSFIRLLITQDIFLSNIASLA